MAIHFQGFRYLSITLAANVGEDITIRYDPQDMAEIRVFYKDRLLCRANLHKKAEVGRTLGANCGFGT